MVTNKTGAGDNKQASQSQPIPAEPLTAAQKLRQSLLDSYDLEELPHVCRSTLYNWQKGPASLYRYWQQNLLPAGRWGSAATEE